MFNNFDENFNFARSAFTIAVHRCGRMYSQCSSAFELLRVLEFIKYVNMLVNFVMLQF